VKDVLEMFTVLRKANVKFLMGLPKEKLNNFGLHQERGMESIQHIINLEAGHDLNHLKQIQNLLSPKKSGKKK